MIDKTYRHGDVFEEVGIIGLIAGAQNVRHKLAIVVVKDDTREFTRILENMTEDSLEIN